MLGDRPRARGEIRGLFPGVAATERCFDRPRQSPHLRRPRPVRSIRSNPDWGVSSAYSVRRPVRSSMLSRSTRSPPRRDRTLTPSWTCSTPRAPPARLHRRQRRRRLSPQPASAMWTLPGLGGGHGRSVPAGTPHRLAPECRRQRPQWHSRRGPIGPDRRAVRPAAPLPLVPLEALKAARSTRHSWPGGAPSGLRRPAGARCRNRR